MRYKSSICLLDLFHFWYVTIIQLVLLVIPITGPNKAFHFLSSMQLSQCSSSFLNLQTHVKSQIPVTPYLFNFSRKALGDGGIPVQKKKITSTRTQICRTWTCACFAWTLLQPAMHTAVQLTEGIRTKLGPFGKSVAGE